LCRSNHGESEWTPSAAQKKENPKNAWKKDKSAQEKHEIAERLMFWLQKHAL
jgi:hypothetical protein